MNGPAAIDILRRIGVLELGGLDGCYCMFCSIQGVDIDVACRKSGGSHVYRRIAPDFRGLVVRCTSEHMDRDMTVLQAVADVVCEQVATLTSEAIVVRLCTYQQDADQVCCYCGKPRPTADGYFCGDHNADSNADWR